MENRPGTNMLPRKRSVAVQEQITDLCLVAHAMVCACGLYRVSPASLVLFQPVTPPHIIGY